MERWLRLAVGPTLNADAILGDLREEFASIRERRGAWVADAWFFVEATRLGIRRLPARVGGACAGLWRDVLLSLRSLRRTPGFTLVVALTLALGLGANTAIYSVLRSVVLEPPPFPDPDRVVAVRFGAEGGSRSGAASFPLFLDLQRDARSFTALGAWKPWQAAFAPDDGSPPVRVDAAAATYEIFDVLDLQGVRGRVFAPEDEQEGVVANAVVRHAFWAGALGRDPDVLGRSLRLNGIQFRIVGVLPESFAGDTDGGGTLPPASVDVWVPLRNSPASEGIDFRGLHNANVVGRLAEAVSLADAEREVDRVLTAVGEIHEESAGTAARLIAAPEAVVGDADERVKLLFGAVVLVLLLACLNAANLLLGRSAGRVRELSVRRALGASEGRLLRLLLAESLVLACAGGVLAVGLAWGGVRLLRASDPGSLPRLQSAQMDAGTWMFLGLSVLAVGLVLGLVPGWFARRPETRASMGGSNRGGSGHRGRLRPALVVAQVSAATVLLTSAVLMAQSLFGVLRVDPGFETSDLLTARVDHPTPFVSDDWPRHVAFFQEVLQRVRAHPSVESAAAAYQDPADPGWTNSFAIVGDPDRLLDAVYRPITPGYFQTVGARLVEGRSIEASDDHGAPGVVVVNEAFVRAYLSDRDALGTRLDYGDFWQARPDREYEIIGVVADLRFAGSDQDVGPAVYLAHAQHPVKEMALIVRTVGPPLAFLPTLRETVRQVDPSLPVFAASTLEAKLGAGSAERRFLATLLASFAGVALVLSGVGLYGVLAFLVSRQRKEIGIRMAIGATPEAVRGLVIRQGMRWVVLGLAVAVPLTFMVVRGLRGFLFQVGPLEPSAHGLTWLTMAAVGLLACSLPSLRATRVDPAEALRSD